MDVTCNVIEDLLPLYADGVCSEDTKTIIEHHIAVCPECKEKLAAMTAKLEKKEKKAKLENPFKKVKNHYLRLVMVTLLVCALIIVPIGGVWFLKTNELYDVGYSWATVTTNAKLRKIAKLFKKGKYREALDLFEPYGKGEYTAEETNAFKDFFAERFEEYFDDDPIKNISWYAENGECRRGFITISTANDNSNSPLFETFSIVFLNNENGGLDFLEYQGQWYMMTALPNMVLPPKDSAEQYFENLNTNVRNFSYWLHTREREESESWGNRGGWYGDVVVKNEERITALLENYGYVGCECGEIRYCGEEYNDYDFRHFYDYFMYENIFERYNLFLQKTVLTMQTKDGEQFTVEFELPIIIDVQYTMLNNNYIGSTMVLRRFASPWGTAYSDNTPEDFKTRFEEIFT